MKKFALTAVVVSGVSLLAGAFMNSYIIFWQPKTPSMIVER